MGLVRDSCGTRAGLVRDLCGTCAGLVRDLCGTRVGLLPDAPKMAKLGQDRLELSNFERPLAALDRQWWRRCHRSDALR